MAKQKVSIVGAGTAGAILAKNLAKFGIRTVVYDRKYKPGSPQMASGILSIKGLESLKINYKKAITNTLYGARIHAGKSTLKILSEQPQAHVVDRQVLNEICIEEAKEAGAEFVLGKQIGSNELNELSKEGIVVGADGAVSTVAKHFGLSGKTTYILTYRAEYEWQNEEKSVDLFFDSRISPGFFSWMAPTSKDTIEIATGIDSRFGNAKSAFENFLNAYVREAADKKPISAYASIIPLISKKRIVDEKKKVLLVGDAAGQVKASTGGGVIFGGNAAIIAAWAIKENIERDAPLSDYEKAFKKKFGVDMLLHKLVHGFYSSLGTKGMEIAINIMNAIGMGEFLSKHGDMDSPSLIIKRLFHIH
ncbi:MAG: FAD-dependent monooxygenase [Candidatus Micrarchaeia archaeon]